MIFLIGSFLGLSVLAQTPALSDYSKKINSELPETYDRITRLLRTTVENDGLVFHFLVDASADEFALAHPKVKNQVLKTICKHGREGRALKELGKAVIYRYENGKGQSLGEFLVRPAHCGK